MMTVSRLLIADWMMMFATVVLKAEIDYKKNETTAARNTKLAKRLMDGSMESKTIELSI